MNENIFNNDETPCRKDAKLLSERSCPICNKNASDVLFDRVVDNFDGVTFNRQILIVSCDNCGVVYNDLNIDADTLEKYYQNDTLYSGETGFGIGGTTPADVQRYSNYLKFLEPVLSSKDIFIADVGCAKGGFLAFLKDNGLTRLSGIEVDPKCVEYARNNFGLNVENGSLHSLPFDNGKLDLLIYNHVLEHLYDPLEAIKEAKRVLKDDGIIFIEVPNAPKYSEGRIFDYFWFCMREHINHFDSTHLTMLMKLAGFKKINDYQQLMPVSSNYYYPSLCALFKNNGRPETKKPGASGDLSDALRRYINTEDKILGLHQISIGDLSASGLPVYIWGISLEFFSLYSLAGLRNCNIRGLIDRNITKQGKTVNGLSIVSPESLKSLSPDAILVITSVFHKNEMLKHLKLIGFKGQVMAFFDDHRLTTLDNN